MRTVWVIARHTFTECARRRIFLIVPLITVGFVGLYALGAHYAFRSARGTVEMDPGLVDANALAGSTLVGLSMFVTLFLTSSLGIFLTFGAVRGDAEAGVLQQLVVRPVARWGLLAGRFTGASLLCAAYALVLYLSCVAVTGATGGWWPDPFLGPGLALMAAVVVVIALSLLGSVFLSSLPNGIVIFMVFGAGLLGGLLAQLGDVIDSPALRSTGRITSWLLPFEALYQAGLNSLTSGATGLTRVIVQLGPLGGAQEGGLWLPLWALAYVVAVLAAAMTAFASKDL